MRGNPSGNLVPECEPRKGVNWRPSVLDAQSSREDSADNSDTYSLVLDLMFIPNANGLCKGGTKKVTDDIPVRRRRLPPRLCALN